MRLFQNSPKKHEDNVLISPLPILCALAMTANGAQGQTRSQMESAFEIPLEQLNKYLGSYVQTLPQDNAYRLNTANSIWFRDDARLRGQLDFLQLNADYFHADLYQVAFDDTTVKDINTWSKKTRMAWLIRL